jgi:formylglycine-generating enzyme required for sulfatase activity
MMDLWRTENAYTGSAAPRFALGGASGVKPPVPVSDSFIKMSDSGTVLPLGAVYISKYEVTQKEYQALMGKNPSANKGPNLPVENITVFDAMEYCNALSRRDNLRPVYGITNQNGSPKVEWNPDADGYRLPVVEEWNYAFLKGYPEIDPAIVAAYSKVAWRGVPIEHTAYYLVAEHANTAGAELQKTAWYMENSDGKSQPAGTKAPDAFGLYDMLGNVGEYVYDAYFGDPSGSGYIVFGSSYRTKGEDLAWGRKLNTGATGPYKDVGFRVVRPAYDYWKYIDEGVGMSSKGPIFPFEFMAPPPAPAAPAVKAQGTSSVTLTWDVTGTEAGTGLEYIVYCGTSNKIAEAQKISAPVIGQQSPIELSGSTYTYTVKNPEKGKTYYFWLSAQYGYLDFFESEKSPVRAITIP